MRNLDLFDSKRLAKQIAYQKRMAWDIDCDIPWDLSVNAAKFLVPLDERDLGFQGLAQEQRIALSQLMGLIINETISEMESSLPRLKYLAWEKSLKKYPVNPEMMELGELFFAEEEKHAESFNRYFRLFCEKNRVEPSDLRSLLPKALNSNFQRAMIWNAQQGGFSFWWVVAAVEEVSIQVFRAIQRNKADTDPLFYEIHRKHTEEEARHENYAFLMLQLAQEQERTLKTKLLHRTDLLLAEILPGPWVLTELTKIFEVKKLKNRSPFFEVLSTCLPLLDTSNKTAFIKNIFRSTPYISWFINPAFRSKHLPMKQKLKAASWAAKPRHIDFESFEKP